MWGRWGVIAALGAGALPWWAPPAGPPAPEFVYEVTGRATLRDVPGTELRVDARAGEAFRLTAQDLSARPVSALAAGDNVGNTFAVSCAGPQLGPGAELGGYWAANLVPPGEEQVTPELRWLLVAPTAGAYRCGLKVSAYSTIVDAGRKVAMRIPAGARLTREKAPGADRWTLAAADLRLVGAGESVRVLEAVYPVRGGAGVRVVQDAALSTCKATSSIPGCAGGSADFDGSTVDTWVEVRARAADGGDCGAPALAPEHRISTAKHHLSATHTAEVPGSRLAGCARVEVALVVRHLSGNPVLVHAGTSAGHAATRGFASRTRADT
ncbi:hypothetical protein GCM10010124_32780 [Pilimelia terevasa]|uniref:Uncharacterized protein n=1 Tax=Pilimelia terevasa TaxID=53372 RepID=A0A8J3BP78_9ACTN|nr:hypothetical protein [Pilimelia terevasa]GGK37427.1 hypothetical protein GCM10010124_32780 [Pilimelia terevasa]